MLSETSKQIIIDTARRYHVSAIYLFGSSLNDKAKAHDIDLGVLGVPAILFFDFYAELVKRLPKAVDLVDLSKPTLFNRLILRDGIKIYSWRGAKKEYQVSDFKELTHDNQTRD